MHILLFLLETSIWLVMVQSVITGILASLIFLFLLFFLRPRILIADQIAKYNGNYAIKVVNRSYFKLYDVNVELVLLKPFNTYGGKNLLIERLDLKKDRIWYIAGKPFREKNSAYGTHAIIFKCDEDLEKKWESDKGVVLHFKVIAKHGLSSFTRIETKKYHDKETDIKNGKYTFGKKCEIN